MSTSQVQEIDQSKKEVMRVELLFVVVFAFADKMTEFWCRQ